MKNKLIILTLLLSIFSFGCDIEKEYSGPTAPYEIPPVVTNLDKNNLSTFNGLYRINAFKKDNNSSECISYAETVQITSCSEQKPFEPLSIKGYVYLEYNKESGSMAVAYKYDMYDKNNNYFTKTNKSTSLSSYKYQDIATENTFSNFELNKEITNTTTNKLFISNPSGNTIPHVKLTTENGQYTYDFALEKVQDAKCLQDTHTPFNIALPFKNYKLQTPINLSKEAEEDKDVCKYGEANPNDAVSLMAYYEVTRMQIYDYDTDDYKNGNNVIYDTDTRESDKRFKGEFWITNHPTKQLLESDDKKIYLQAAFKYQVDSETKLNNISFPLTNTNNPLLLDISIPLQGGDYFIIDTFALVAQWDSASPQRTRQVIFKPEDKSNAVTFEVGGKKYIVVLTLERLLNAYGEGIGTPDGKINFFQDGTTTPITTPYWN